MKGIVLAGGFGTRLRPLTFKLPKPMVPILGRPMMEHIVERLRATGINECISLLYFEPDVIRDYFGDGSKFGMRMEYALSQADWGTAGAVKNAAGRIDDTVLVISGDVLTDFDLEKAIAFHKERSAEVTIVLKRVRKPLAYGIVIANQKTGRIERFLEKPALGQVFSDTINTGIYIIQPHVLDYIPHGEEFDFSKDLFPLLMSKQEPLFGYIADGYWRDVGDLREYRRANEDALGGTIELEIPGRKERIGDADVYMGADVEIEDGALFKGKVLLGDGCRVRSGAEIVDSVLGAGDIVCSGARVLNSVIWENVTVGKRAMIQHTIVANDVVIGEDATLCDHSVVSENCIIGSSATIGAAVKIWPGKEIEAHSVVNETLVHGDRMGGDLFTGSRLSGVINLEISPEFSVKIGSSLGTSLKGKGTVMFSRDGDRASQITERALFCGVMSAGVNVEDLGVSPIPVMRWLLSRNPRSAGVHIRKSPKHRNGQDVIFLNGNGTDLSTSQTRSIERILDGEDFPRADYDSLGTLERPSEGLIDYRRALKKSIDIDLVRKSGFRIVVDYSHGGTAGVLPEVLSDIGVDTVNVNAVVEPNRITRTREQREADQQRLAIIVGSLEADAGFLIDPSGERLHLVDETGRLLDEDSELCIVTDLVIRTSAPRVIACPISATMGVNRLTRDAGVELQYTRDNHLAMMEAAFSGQCDFVGGTRGGFIFPQWLFASDAIFATLKILEMMAAARLKLSDLADALPGYVRAQREIHCSFDSMGTIMRRLIEETADRPRDVIDGVRVYTQDSWVLVIPDRENPVFHLIAEAKTPDRLNEVLDEYVAMLNGWLVGNGR